jgi:hypothetical protein
MLYLYNIFSCPVFMAAFGTNPQEVVCIDLRFSFFGGGEGAFAKFGVTAVFVILSVVHLSNRLSVCPHARTRVPLNRFLLNFIS